MVLKFSKQQLKIGVQPIQPPYVKYNKTQTMLSSSSKSFHFFSPRCHQISPLPIQTTNIDTTTTSTSISFGFKTSITSDPNTKHLFLLSHNYPSNLVSPIVGTEKALDENKLVDVISHETQNSQVLRSKVRKRRKGRLLVLDLNGILADIMCVVPRGYKPDKKLRGNSVFRRPFSDDFLSFCFDNFDVGVWSSRSKKNVNSLVDFLMGDMRHHLLFCWDNSYCTKTGFKTVENRHKPLVLKELKKLWDKEDPILPWEAGEYNETNTLLLDDSPYKALRNPPHTGVFPYSYRLYDLNDISLGPGGDIRCYLQGLAMAESVQKYVVQNPFGQSRINTSGGFYSEVACAENFQISYS